MTEAPSRSNPATIADVARLAGVSVATVSRALRGFDNVAPKTMARVIEAADSLDYRSNPHASRLRSGTSRAISLVLPSVDSWYGSELMAGAEAVLAEAGYDTLVAAAAGSAAVERVVASVQPRWGRVDGLIVIDYELAGDLARKIESWNCPIVVVGESTSSFSSVRIDDRRVAIEATEHLLGLGHRRIGLIQGIGHRTDERSASGLRRLGYHQALTKAGVEHDPQLETRSSYGVAGSREAVASLFAQTHPPTAILCMSDLIAVGALRTLMDLGFTVPDDVSIIGIDDQEVAEAIGLTTVRQPAANIGAAASRLLLDQLGGDPGGSQLTIETELIVRSTTGPHRPT